jgi:prepilin-type processing-associated H-X9-DG protein
MYTQDYDETFPLAHVEGQWENSGWILRVAPYIKNYGVLRCPSDPLDPSEPWEGESLSYAANSYYTNGADVTANVFKGVLGMAFDYPGVWVDPPNSRELAGVTRTADTIMVAEKYDEDTFKNTGWMGNRSGLGASQIIYGMGNFWGPGLIPDGGNPGIPARLNGTTAKAYPDGPNGSVTASHSEMSNFAFVDGHVKAMRPIQTNPDGRNRPLDNMWDATR